MKRSNFSGAVLTLLLFCAASASAAAATAENVDPPVVAREIYVSPSGADANDGTRVHPFATLERAQSAARVGARPVTIYLLEGRYERSRSLRLDTRDAQEIWAAEAGQTAFLDGQNTVLNGIEIYGPDITISGVLLSNFQRNGILAQNVQFLRLVGNTITNIGSDRWATGAINIMNSASGVLIADNVVARTGYGGIVVENTPGDQVSNIQVVGNRVEGACRKVADCGAIYLDDRTQQATSLHVIGNVVRDFGTTLTQGRGIYLDDYVSGVEVRCNIVAGPGSYAVQVHGGDYNLISDNVFDLRLGEKFLLYQELLPDGAYRRRRMDGNRLIANLVVSKAGPDELAEMLISADSSSPSFVGNRFLTPDAPEADSLRLPTSCRATEALPAIS